MFFLGAAITSITLALVFYTIGTWSEKVQGRLKLWHIVFFLLGLVYFFLVRVFFGAYFWVWLPILWGRRLCPILQDKKEM